jgi:hypothetical protein
MVNFSERTFCFGEHLGDSCYGIHLLHNVLSIRVIVEVRFDMMKYEQRRHNMDVLHFA